MDDAKIHSILEAASHQKTLKQLSLSDCEFGKEARDKLLPLFERRPPDDIEEIRLNNLKII